MGLGDLFGGGTQTVETAPWKAQQPYLKTGFGRAQDLLNRPDFDPAQTQGYNMALGYADSMSPMIGNAQSALNFAMNPNILSPDSNPYLQQYAEAAARPLMQNLTESILPSLGSSAELAGQYGGSRQGIAEGIAARGTQQAIADQNSRIFSNAYGQGLNTMMQGIGQSGNVANLGLMPSNIYQSVGGQRQQVPWQNLQNYMGTVGGNYGSTQTTPTGNPLGSLIGLGAGLTLAAPTGGMSMLEGGTLGMAAGGLLS